MIQVRFMQEADTEHVSILEKQIFSQPWTQKGFADSIKLDHTIFLIAEEAGRIIGYAGMYYTLGEGEITNIAVAPQERHRGIGSILIQEIQKAAVQKGVTKIALEVRASNINAIRLYEQSGFAVCGVRKEFYEFPREDAYIMIYEKE